MIKKYLAIILILTSAIFSQTINSTEFKIDKKVLLNQNDFLIKNEEEKSNVLAFLYSFILPGMGELYLNRYDVGQYFTIADGLLWISLAGFNYYGIWQRDNYRNYAVQNASITLDNKNDDFFADVSNYLSVYDYNQEKYLNREFNKVYDVKTHFWQWDSNEKRKEYRSMWKNSEQSFINTSFIIAGLILNRVISGINAAIMAANYNESINSGQIKINSNFEYNPNLNAHFIKINLFKSF